MTVYFNGEFVDKDDVSLSPDDRGFVFADGIYEVLRAQQGHLFQEDRHFQRLERSLQEIHLTDVDVAEIREAVHSLLYRNDLQDQHAKVYLQVTRGAAPRQHAVPTPAPTPTVYATAEPHTPPVDQWEEGVNTILHPDQRWARCDIKSISLLPNILASDAAKAADAYEAILVRDGFVTEGSHSTVVAVFDDTVVTHPLTNHILPSTTRALVLNLSEEHDIPVQEVPIPKADLPDADELMVLGTTTGIMPVVQVDDWTVGDGTPGPVTRTLQTAFRALEPA